MNTADRIASIAAIPADKITPSQRATLTALATERDVYCLATYTSMYKDTDMLAGPFCAIWVGRDTLSKEQWVKYEMVSPYLWLEYGPDGMQTVNPDEILQQQMPSHRITPVTEMQG